MELDELKSAWAQYDKKLTASLRLNEQLLKNINTHQSKLELQKPLLYEGSGVVLQLILEVILIVWSLRINELRFTLPGLAAAALGLVYLYIGAAKTYGLMSIDYYGSSVVSLQRQITTLNATVLRLRKVEFALAPFFLLLVLPVILKTIHGIDIYANVPKLWLTATVVVALTFPLMFVVNRYLYDQKFKNVNRLLKEITDFESGK